ncbi:MAG: hypothetical protein C0183_01195, partial [Roseiflexus castenholzii]
PSRRSEGPACGIVNRHWYKIYREHNQYDTVQKQAIGKALSHVQRFRTGFPGEVFYRMPFRV